MKELIVPTRKPRISFGRGYHGEFWSVIFPTQSTDSAGVFVRRFAGRGLKYGYILDDHRKNVRAPFVHASTLPQAIAFATEFKDPPKVQP